MHLCHYNKNIHNVFPVTFLWVLGLAKSKFQGLLSTLWQVTDLSVRSRLCRLLTESLLSASRPKNALFISIVSQGEVLPFYVMPLPRTRTISVHVKTFNMFSVLRKTWGALLFTGVYIKRETHKWGKCRRIFLTGNEIYHETLMKPFGFVEIFAVNQGGSKPQPSKVYSHLPLMPVLCFYVAVPSSPSGGDSGRPDEDTFGVSFLLDDVDETAAIDAACGLNRELNTNLNCFLFVKGLL